MSRETVADHDDDDKKTIEVTFDLDRDMVPDITKIAVYVPALDDFVDLAHSSDDRLQKLADGLVAGFIANYEQIVNDRLENAAMMECKDYEL